MVKRRRELVKEFGLLCQDKLPGTNYDRFFIEEVCKKIKTTEEIDTIVTTLRTVEPEEFKERLLEELGHTKKKTEEEKALAKKIEDEAKKLSSEAKKDEWTLEELSLLSKAIVKYPGAIPNRWKIITDYIETDKTQKQVIAKAQELSQKSSLAKAGKTVVQSSFSEKMAKEEKK